MSETRTRIKICGITNLDDALAAVECGADALGFIFVPNTPRYMGDPDELDRILRDLPPFVARVAVCSDAAQAAVFRASSIDTIQFYQPGRGLDDILGNKRFIHAFRIRDEHSLNVIASTLDPAHTHAIHLDAYHPDKLGGSGETFNWDLAREVKARFNKPIILAGGLTPDNVADAIAAVRPYAVDVSTGVEAEPGRKDPARFHAFIRAVLKADSLNA